MDNEVEREVGRLEREKLINVRGPKLDGGRYLGAGASVSVVYVETKQSRAEWESKGRRPGR